MLTRYSRTQFTDPNLIESTEKIDKNSTDGEYDEISASIMDPDHRLLLKSTKPLLQSRNSSVIFLKLT